jgi:hypothetical protein
MRRFFAILALLLSASLAFAVPPSAPISWQARVDQSMPLLGHRNWILIVDSAYPLQSSTGIETIETDADQLEVVRYVLGSINHSIHVRPVIVMDTELPFVRDDDAPGASTYRAEIGDLLHAYPVQSLPHEKVISTIDEASRQFHVLVLKTRMTIPYTSVFLRLDCKYWSAEAESRLRSRMSAAQIPAAKPNR